MKKVLNLSLISALSLGLVAGCAGTTDQNLETIKLIYTHYQPGTPDQPKQAAALAFKAYVENATNGRIEVEIYPNSELGDGPVVLEAMKSNTIQMTVVHDGPVSALYPAMGVFNLPFLYNSHAEAWAMYDGPFVKNLGDQFRTTTGLRLLGMADNGVRHLTNSKRPITQLSEASGLVIRVQPSPVYEAIVKGMGASPIAVAWAELPAALQQGVADGQENGITNILAAKLYETQKYLTLTGHVYSYHAYLINEQFYSGLTQSEKEAIVQGVELAKWIHRGMTSSADNMISSTLAKYGVTVTALPADKYNEFRVAVQPGVVTWMKQQYGNAVVDGVLAEINRIRG
jgi:TRAP-type transport system periplasmic protein